MNNKNLETWNLFEKTNPEDTKSFSRSGGFRGTAISPISSIKRMTEKYGVIGEGWGTGEPRFEVVPAEEEILVFCWLYVWHTNPNNRFYGTGGDKVLIKQSSGLRSSDEAFKSAFTDAMTNAFKMLGIGADVHEGKFDSNKYVDQLKEEFAEKSGKPKLISKVQADLLRSFVKEKGIETERIIHALSEMGYKNMNEIETDRYADVKAVLEGL